MALVLLHASKFSVQSVEPHAKGGVGSGSPNNIVDSKLVCTTLFMNSVDQKRNCLVYMFIYRGTICNVYEVQELTMSSGMKKSSKWYS